MKKSIFKKVLSLLLVSILLFAMAACSKKETKKDEKKEDIKEESKEEVKEEVKEDDKEDVKEESKEEEKETEEASDSKDKYRIVYAICDKETTTAVASEDRMKELEKEYDNIEFTYMANSNADTNVAIENARNVITLKPDLYINYLVSAASEQVGEMMAEAGQPMLSVQSRCGDTPLCAIDNIQIGHDMAVALTDYYKENWADEEDVQILFANMPDSGQMFVDRQTGSEEYFAQEIPDIPQSLINGHGNMETNRQMFADFLTAHPNSKVLVWAHIDEPAFGILAAAEAAHRTDDIVIVSTGGIADFYSEMQEEGSPLLGTVDYFPDKWSDTILEVALDMLEGKEVPYTTVLYTELVTLENLAELRPEYVID